MNIENLPIQYHSKAEQERALRAISRQYELLRKQALKFILNDKSHELRSGDRYDQLSEIYWGLPRHPHQVREKHYAWFGECGIDANQVRGLVTARDYIKSLPIVKKPKVEKSEGKRTERSAKYWGVCQICGKEHKVDIKTGLLADHGYKVEFGYYQGSCVGSAQLPLNVSCDFLRSEYNKVSDKLNLLLDRKGDEVYHTYDREVYSWRTKETKIVTVNVYVSEVRARLNNLICNWKPILDNWKPTDLTPIKYDN